MREKMKIYVRERLKVGKGVKQPRFRVVAVTGTELRIQASPSEEDGTRTDRKGRWG